MNISVFLFILLFIKICCGELPGSSCRNLKPFKTKDNNCDDFTNICVKKDDPDCNSFLEICTQCPATNYSVLMFHDIAQVKAEKIDSDKKLLKITIELQNLKSDIGRTTVNIHILLYVCIAINLVLLVVLILEIRFKLITKLIEKHKHKGPGKYQLLESRKLLYRKDFDDKIKNLEQRLGFDEKIKKLEEKLDLVPEIDRKVIQILQNFKNFSNSIITKTKFYIEGNINPIEIEVGKNNTVVQVKKQICSEIQNCVPYGYKIMKLSLSGQLMEDNRYFSSFNLSEEDKIDGEFDQNVDPNNIVVIQLKGNVKLPKLIRIEKFQTISYLRKVINTIEDINENCEIFCWNKINKNQMKKINNNATIEECQLEDDDIIQIILRKEENVKITSIFTDDISIRIKISNVDLVSDLRNIIAEKLQFDPNELFLLLNDRMLSNDKFAFEYFTEKRAQVKYCKFMNLDDIVIDDKTWVKGTFGDLFNSKKKRNKMEMLIKRYKIMVVAVMEDNFHIIQELKKFQITKSHPRFIQVLDLYKDDDYVFVAMENMSNGTLSKYLKNIPTRPENQIVMWSTQILEGLKFLHQNEIIHRDLNPKSIFLDKSLHIKLSNFNLSKYSNFHNQQTFSSKFNQKARIPLRYVAPETIIKDVYNYQTDVWSFGAIFLRIVTHKKPYDGITKNIIINQINQNGCKNYKCKIDVPIDEKEIIEMCMKGSPEDRSTVANLLEMSYFKKANINKS